MIEKHPGHSCVRLSVFPEPTSQSCFPISYSLLQVFVDLIIFHEPVVSFSVASFLHLKIDNHIAEKGVNPSESFFHSTPQTLMQFTSGSTRVKLIFFLMKKHADLPMRAGSYPVTPILLQNFSVVRNLDGAELGDVSPTP